MMAYKPRTDSYVRHGNVRRTIFALTPQVESVRLIDTRYDINGVFELGSCLRGHVR